MNAIARPYPRTEGNRMRDQSFAAERIDTGKPHPARMYDYYLGGHDNHEVDRRAADRLVEQYPDVLPSARANRDFLLRAVRTVADAGIRQIVDIGTGIPTSPNTHEVARESAPDTRVVYIDNDPIVATHARARLTSAPGTGFVHADLRDPEAILRHPVVREIIDFEQPVALILVAVLHFVPEEDDPAGIVATLTKALPRGSHLVLSHGTLDFHDHIGDEAAEIHRSSTASLHLRSHPELTPLFDGFELLDPGLVQVPLWRPEGALPEVEVLRRVGVYGGIGVKD